PGQWYTTPRAPFVRCRHASRLRAPWWRPQHAWALRNLAFAAMETGAPARTAELFAESLAMFRDQDVALGIASNLVGIASLAARDGQLDRAGRLVATVKTMLADSGLELAPADAIALERAQDAVGAVARSQGLASDEPRVDVGAAIA